MIKMISRIFFTLIITGLVLTITSKFAVYLVTKSRIFDLDEAIPAPVAVVFGAGLKRDGTPTPVLMDRVRTGAYLYFNGNVSKLLMSGDNRFVDYNEPESMGKYAIELGVPEEDIVLDYAGRRTYDTCFRAKEIFGLDQVILVTQKYHLPRALYSCQKMGIESTGIPADYHKYSTQSQIYWNTRELLATLVALIEIHITHPTPVLGDPEPIY